MKMTKTLYKQIAKKWNELDIEVIEDIIATAETDCEIGDDFFDEESDFTPLDKYAKMLNIDSETLYLFTQNLYYTKWQDIEVKW